MTISLKPNNFNLRVDRESGDIWLTYEKRFNPMRKIKNLTEDICLAMCKDLTEQGAHNVALREVKFSDGFTCKITVEMVKDDG